MQQENRILCNPALGIVSRAWSLEPEARLRAAFEFRNELEAER
jgi:hypothetical protein